ncbi:MAG: hypothetical protein VKJ44_04860 [Synechococcus sp.]|nr:hypothetical protein [Synechococcus sp.]
MVFFALLALLLLLLWRSQERLRQIERRLQRLEHPGPEQPPASMRPPAPVPAWGLTAPADTSLTAAAGASGHAGPPEQRDAAAPARLTSAAAATAAQAAAGREGDRVVAAGVDVAPDPGAGGAPPIAPPREARPAGTPDRVLAAPPPEESSAAAAETNGPPPPPTAAPPDPVAAIAAIPAPLPAALVLPAAPLFSPSPGGWRRLERRLIEQWVGILGVVVLVCGLTFLAANLALRLDALLRFLLTLSVGGGLMLPSLHWGTNPRWRPLSLWLRSGGAALVLFACMAAGALPQLGMRWLQDPGPAWAVLLLGIAVNLALAWWTRHQGLASLHVLLPLVPLLVSPRGGLTLAVGSATALWGQILPLRRPWDRHRLLLALGYGLFQLGWSLGAGALIARLPGLRSEALLWSLLVFGSGIGLVQHAPGRDRLPALRLAALLASWGGVALALLIHPGQIGVRVTALLLSALVAAVLARVAQRRGLRDLQLAQTLVAQALLLLALLGLGPLLLDNLLLTVLLLLESGLFLLFGLLSQERLIRRSGWWLVVLLSLALVLQGLLRLDFDLVTPTAASLRDTGLLLSSAALLVGLASQYTRLALAAPWPPLLGWLAAALVVIATSLLPPPLWQPGCALVGTGGLLLAERRLRPAGLASGSLAAVAVAHLLAWHGLLEVERPTGQLLVLLLPLLLLAGLLTATASRSGRRCLGIDLLGLDLALAAYCLLQPISPLLPGVAWLLLSLLGLELADRLRRPEADHVLALAACMLAGFVSHFLLVTSRSPAVVVLPGLVLRARLAIELFALAVTLRWGTFQARPRLRQAEPWQQLQPCFLEFSLLVVATTILSELDSLLRPLAWSLLALLLLSPWLRRRFAARCQIYALLTYWLAIAATPAILGSAGMPSPRWFEQPALLSTLAILLQVLFLVLSRRWLCSEALADPGGWPLLGWIGARLSGRSQRWLGYPLFLAVALHLAGRYDQGLLTLLWTLEATVIFGLGVLQRDQQVRIVALLALGLCLYRLLAVDMAAADPVLRGLVFVGVGLLMLAMNVISNRFRDRIR